MVHSSERYNKHKFIDCSVHTTYDKQYVNILTHALILELDD